MQLRHTWAIAAIAAILAVFTLPATAANPTPSAAMMKPIQAALNAINTVNPSSLKSGVYASNATVVDEFSRYTWSGPGAGVDWVNDFIKFTKKAHFTDGKGTLMPVKIFDQTGDRAYIVVPTNFDGKINGKPVHETGTWTFTLQRSNGSWLILTETWGTIKMVM